MPTVLRIEGWRVAIYPNDHEPAHVHVIGSGGEVIFQLNCPAGPLELRGSYRVARTDVSRLEKALGDYLIILCNEWRKIHGND